MEQIKFMKRLLLISLLMIIISTMQSCYTTTYVDYVVSCIDDFNKDYMGRTKNYIIANFQTSPTEVKRLDEQYEMLIFERVRNPWVGNGITKFLLKNGVCYKIETNEFKKETRLERVNIWRLVL